MRHIDPGHLWIQETSADKRAKYQKAEGSVNLADLTTKALPAQVAHEHTEAPAELAAAGRSQLAASADMHILASLSQSGPEWVSRMPIA